MTAAPRPIRPIGQDWPSASRHLRPDARAWWRCLIRGLGFGSVTGYIPRRSKRIGGLGAIITSYEVQCDDGTRIYRTPAELEHAHPLAGREWLIGLTEVRP